MVGTPSGDHGEVEFRPLTAARVDGDRIEILLDTREEWVTRFNPFDMVDVVLSDTRANDWAHLRGSAQVRREASLIDDLWNPFAAAYFEDGRDTDGIAVLDLSITSGRYWSSPSGRVGSVISVLRAAVGRDSGGEQGAVEVR